MAAVAATMAGSAAAVAWMRSFVAMQGFTLISDVVAILLVVGLAWWQTRRFRPWMAPTDYRGLFQRSLLRLSAWALAGYMAYMAVLDPLLRVVGFHYAT